MMIHNARNHEQYIRAINAGLENTIGLLDSLPIKDEKILAELRSFKNSYDTILNLYGQIPKSPDSAMQMLHDQTIAESLRMINSFKDFSQKQEENSEMIRIQSRNASPKGAVRMTAESNAMILKSLNQLIRLQSQSLKMQSEQFAHTNKGDKQSVASYQRINNDLGNGFKNFKHGEGFIRF